MTNIEEVEEVEGADKSDENQQQSASPVETSEVDVMQEKSHKKKEKNSLKELRMKDKYKFKPSGKWSVPTAPMSWTREPRQGLKHYSLMRPNDYVSFREIAHRSNLLRVIIGRLVTEDGHDMNDDYTVPIEEEFLHKPFAWILRNTFCLARGVPPLTTVLSVRFALDQAGAGLGWLDCEKNPVELTLRDGDILQVLITRDVSNIEDPESLEQLEMIRNGTYGEEDHKHRWMPKDWQEATNFFEGVQSGAETPSTWVPKVWTALEKHADDDHVVRPGLQLLLDLAKAPKPDSVDQEKTAEEKTQEEELQEETQQEEKQEQSQGEIQIELPPLRIIGEYQNNGVTSAKIILRILDAHPVDGEIQCACWELLKELAAEIMVQPLLVQRGGVRAKAKKEVHRFEKEGGEGMKQAALLSMAVVLERLEKVPDPSRTRFEVKQSQADVPNCAQCGKKVTSKTQCGKCKSIFYCDRSCQRLHWPKHKGDCATLAAALPPRQPTTGDRVRCRDNPKEKWKIGVVWGKAEDGRIEVKPDGWGRGFAFNEVEILPEKEDATPMEKKEAEKDLCVVARERLDTALKQGDSLKIDKTLRALIVKLKDLKVPLKNVEGAGLGKMLKDLTDFVGDEDIRALSRNCIEMIARLQHHTPL